MRPPEVWYHAKHGLHDEAHHQHHDAMDVCVPLDYATPALQGDADAPVGGLRADLATLRRSLPAIVGPGTAELWLAFGRVEQALGHGIYAATTSSADAGGLDVATLADVLTEAHIRRDGGCSESHLDEARFVAERYLVRRAALAPTTETTDHE